MLSQWNSNVPDTYHLIALFYLDTNQELLEYTLKDINCQENANASKPITYMHEMVWTGEIYLPLKQFKLTLYYFSYLNTSIAFSW